MGNLLRTEAVDFNDVHITVQCPTLLTGLRKTELEKRMTDAVTLGVEYLDAYLNVVVQTVNVDGLPFTLPAYSAETESHIKTFELFLNLPGELQVLWHNAAARTAQVPGAADEPTTEGKPDPKEPANASSD